MVRCRHTFAPLYRRVAFTSLYCSHGARLWRLKRDDQTLPAPTRMVTMNTVREVRRAQQEWTVARPHPSWAG